MRLQLRQELREHIIASEILHRWGQVIYYFINSGFKGVFLNTKVRTEGYLTLIQSDHRKFHQSTYQYSPVRVIVLKI